MRMVLAEKMKIPSNKIRVHFTCPDCEGEGYVEIEYCSSPVAIEPSWRDECCESCCGEGVLEMSIQELLEKAFLGTSFAKDEVNVWIEKKTM